ncbi:MAG TPA: hypothetical protein VFW35_10860 [Sphingomicrobium sp.]|nr:hypothetical protein [Sphingomicrobium sp.]
MLAKLASSVMLVAAISATKQTETWFAYSRTAESVTGSIVLSSKALHMSHADFPLHFALKSDHFGTATGPATAKINQVMRPQNPILLNGNRLCRTPVRWIVLWQADRELLGVAAFDSKTMPFSVTSPGYCGSYYYSRTQ